MAWIAALALLAIACGGQVTPEDGGSDAEAPMPDGGRPDDERPRVIGVTPDDGSDSVARSTPFTVRFSEAMRGDVGEVRVRVEGEPLELDPSRTEDGLRLSPDGGWPPASEIEIRLDEAFADLAGNPIDRAYVFRFTTTDDAAPTVVSSDPAEGAAGVSVRTGAVRVRFSEPMDQAAGTVTLEGGPGAIEPAAAWSPFEVSYRLSGLAHDTAYRVVLSGFRDRQGNALDGASLGDGAIDFTTGGDEEPPHAIASTPVEGQVDVLVERLDGAIEVTFDEPMDTSVASAPLTAGTASGDAAITWVDDRTARFAIRGIARVDSVHSLDLRGLRDVAGNGLAHAPYLGDGRLDFTTGIDAFVPVVVASDPVEGATAVRIPLHEIALAFSEAMDESITDVTVTDDRGGSFMVSGTWRAGGTVLSIPGSAFPFGRTVQVDVRGMRDLSGTALSDVHPYLGDGLLDFGLASPTGESCEQPLTIDGATSVMGSRYEFLITRAQRTRNNGSASCDLDGLAETDAVVFYRKTSPALGDPSGEGRALRITTTNVSNRANVEVYRGECDPRSAGAASARVVCATHHDDWDQLLDVPAGDYYIWFSTATASPFDIRAFIEEVDAIPEGERCEDPYDTTSAVYTAPASASEPHVWNLPAGPHNSVDIADSNTPNGAFECSDQYAGDVVVAFDKTGADTVLDVLVSTSSSSARMQVVAGACRAFDPGATRPACVPAVSTTPRRLSVAAPAGPVHFWIAGGFTGNPFAGGRLEVRELPPPTAPGSSCATAIPITPAATVPITPSHASRYFAPSCFGAGADVTWYSFEVPSTLTQIRTVGGGAIGLVDAASGRQASCSTGATTTPVSYFAPVGSRVCVAVESGSAVSALSITSIEYEGAGVTPLVPLNIGRPDLDGTLYEGFSIHGDDWMALTPTTIWQNMGTAGLIFAPRAGGVRSTIRFDVDGAVSRRGVAAGAELWTIGLNSPRRLARLTDASGAWGPVSWDGGADYSRPRTSGTPGTATAATGAIAWHDDSIFAFENISSATFTPRENIVYRYSRTTPGAPEQLGRIDTIYAITAAAVDDAWFYLAARTSTTASTIGIYRVSRAALTGGAVVSPELVAGSASTPILVADSTSSARYLYYAVSGDIFVLEGPGSASPRVLGMILDRDTVDAAMDVDLATGSLTLFSSHEDPEGAWYRLDR